MPQDRRVLSEQGWDDFMQITKLILVVAAVVLSYQFLPRAFPLVVILAGIVWLSSSRIAAAVQSTRTRGTSQAHLFGRRLRLPVAPHHRAFRFQREGERLSCATVHEGEAPGVELLDLWTHGWSPVPFCFVVRFGDALVDADTLVENTAIPGVRFEYRLARIETVSGVQAASNHPDLAAQWIPVMQALADAIAPIRISRIFYNGRALHVRFVPVADASPASAEALVSGLVDLSLTIQDVLDKVTFKASL